MIGYLVCFFQSSNHKSNLRAAWGDHESGSRSRDGGERGVPGEGTETIVLQWLAGFGRRAGVPEGTPSQDLEPPGETPTTGWRFRGRELDLNSHYSSWRLTTLAQAPPTSSGRPSKPANPEEAWVQRRCFPAGSDVVLGWRRSRPKLSAAAQAAEWKNGSDRGSFRGSAYGGGGGSGGVK